MNGEFELVKVLEREPSWPTADEMRTPHAALEAAIDGERATRATASSAPPPANGAADARGDTGRGRRGCNRHVRCRAACARREGCRDRATPMAFVHPRSPARLATRTRRRTCRVRLPRLRTATTSVYTWASDFPLTQPLTEAGLVDECRSGTDRTRRRGGNHHPAGNPLRGDTSRRAPRSSRRNVRSARIRASALAGADNDARRSEPPPSSGSSDPRRARGVPDPGRSTHLGRRADRRER